MSDLTHFDGEGRAQIVDVGEKSISRRVATASAIMRMEAPTLARIIDREIAKGDVQAVARIAGIMGAKQTANLIPLCHPIPIDSVTIDFLPISPTELKISGTVVSNGRTGVEMEALAAVSTTALTVYDMCKAIDRWMTIGRIQLDHKSGGKQGQLNRPSTPQS